MGSLGILQDLLALRKSLELRFGCSDVEVEDKVFQNPFINALCLGSIALALQDIC